MCVDATQQALIGHRGAAVHASGGDAAQPGTPLPQRLEENTSFSSGFEDVVLALSFLLKFCIKPQMSRSVLIEKHKMVKLSMFLPNNPPALMKTREALR